MLIIRHDQTFDFRRRHETTGQRRHHVARQARGAQARNTLNIYDPSVLLEIKDDYFNLNSPVIMPDAVVRGAASGDAYCFEEPEAARRSRLSHPSLYHTFKFTPYSHTTARSEDSRSSGLYVLATALKFVALNPRYLLLIAGHCDTEGEARDGFQLSGLRAQNALHLLLGERSSWVQTCLGNSKVEDYQRILTYYARQHGWDCHPGRIDNTMGEMTASALRRFQREYNARFRRSVAEDGNAGAETWGAFFDLYLREVASILGTDADGLSAHTRRVCFVDRQERYIACANKVPIAQAERVNYYSRDDRRVELLFFAPPLVPDLSCHASKSHFCLQTGAPENCHIYARQALGFVHLDPKPAAGKLGVRKYEGRFAIHEVQDDLTQLHDKPDPEAFLELPIATPVSRAGMGETERAWAFLQPFDEHHPGELPQHIE